ncbi:uncharacterized protein Nmag_0929 [Natrialba magadii ATCC 43099]|uniref:CHAT domain-containing protein n=1 Tax=Natrialba magadii (strain ATCC 43099 / DSM 3394 / CCM 3739 / CIP 104546 / IAM 13178 / JCM 8861 / NBRC 102185 / NCIMB 2190 / MS3) TaxID=547559 RepID=D3SQM5_NATMM|nr:hypothetical protein [Natrialba magadii]ADD04513.1 uncharacterized protein Nmag_0929 [Natrialba magadii ATCC 43099]ELY25170.1 hypothetical protein C500_17171 [Natrialba magadii ATCC 43099]
MTIEIAAVTDPSGSGSGSRSGSGPGPGPGLEFHDSIEQRHLRVGTSTAVSPTTVDPQEFCFPVNKTCTVTTDELRFDQPYSVTVHDETGRTESNVGVGEQTTLEDRPQFIGLSGPIKLYCRIDTAGTVDIGLTAVRIELEHETTVTLGARSLHDRPAGTITTPPDIESMAQALSAFPSALKTSSPERTWPTLRGHPPLIELGETLEIPDAVRKSDIGPETGARMRAVSDTDAADTMDVNAAETTPPAAPDLPATDSETLTDGITITVPSRYLTLFQAAPLAFFLGARIEPGDEPALETPTFTYPLPSDETFGDEIADLLKRFFFLDCLTRTEGIFQYDLLERSKLETELPFELETVYDEPLPERLAQYLEVPFEQIEAHAPRWPLTAHVPPEPESIELLPFIVNELGIVRPSSGETPSDPPGAATAEAQFVRSTSEVPPDSSSGDQTPSRSPSPSPSPSPAAPPDESAFVVPDVTDESVEHAWFGNNVPQNASKATIEAYRNQLDRDTRNDSIELLLVCNDAQMLDEHDLLDDAYGTRDELPFEIDSEFGVDSNRLATLLTEGGYDFVHYIGHATEDGLRCPDGDLDIRTLESVDVGVFFLNACRSYQQGLAMIRRGAFGGVSTYGDVANEDAVEAGETMARLLNRGFPLRGALEIARQNTALGEQYLIVGDGSADIAQSDGGAPAVVKLNHSDTGELDFSIQSYSTKEFQLGTATASNLPCVEDRHLSPGCTPFSSVTETDLYEYLSWNELPMLVEETLSWNDGIGPFGKD